MHTVGLSPLADLPTLRRIAADTGGPKAAAYKTKADAEGAGQQEAFNEAKALEGEREHDLALSDTHEKRHHRLGIAATLLEIGIAISTIAIITRKRWPWLASGLLGAAGAAVALFAYVT